MSTVVIVPTNQSATVDHTFKGTTKSGRDMSIVVTAMRDVSENAVLADLRDTVGADVNIEVDTSSGIGLTMTLVLATLAWVTLGAFIMCACIVCDMAGLANMMAVDALPFWASWLPFVGGQTLGVGLVRLWLIAGPFIYLAFIYMYIREKRGEEQTS